MSNNKEKVTPATNNFWSKFLQKTTDLDSANGDHPGWHWFFGLYYLYDMIPKNRSFLLERVQGELPEEHWLKKLTNEKLKTIIADNDKEFVELFRFLDDLLKKHEVTKVINFSKIHFKGKARFTNFIFPLEVSFEDAEFSCESYFEGAIFRGGANFTNTQFLDTISFDSTKFIGLANFERANFFKRALFSNASFPMIANFQNVNFFESSNFMGAVFSLAANFRNATFHSLPLFKNTTFNGNINFTGACFKTHAPHFHDATISADITWEKNTNLWPQTKKHTNYKTNIQHRTRIENNQSSYENLVYHMKTVEKYHDQHFFFRQEMRCRRNLGSVFNAFLYGTYEILADYGYGVGRAIFWWATHMFLGASILYLFVFYNKSTSEKLICSILNSATNAHSYVFSKGNRLEHCYKDTDMLLVDVVWATQTIVGLAFLFLLGLTLRVRFRMR